MAAVSQDDEVAAQLAKRAPSTGEAGPALTEWSAEVQHLAVIADALLSLRSLFLQVNGAKGVKPPPPLPRPTTALQRAKRAQRDAVRSHVMSRLLPGTRGVPQTSTDGAEPDATE